MRDYIKEVCIIAIPTLLITVLFMQVVAARGVVKVNNGLKEEIEYLESRIELYENNEEWFDDYIDMIEEIYEREVEINVLEERIYWLNKYKENSDFDKTYADQMFSDFEVVIEAMFDYIKVNGNLDNFEEYFLSNHNEVYNRINGYQFNH